MTLNNDLVDNIFDKKRHKEYRKLKHIIVNFEDENINKIDVNKHFWDHIKYHRNNRRRSNKEIIERLRAIKKTIIILEKTIYIQDKYTIKESSKNIKFIFIKGILYGKGIGIVLRSIHNNKKYHLYSIIPDWNGYIPRIEQINGKVTISKI